MSTVLRVLQGTDLVRAQRGPSAADRLMRGDPSVTVDAVIVGSGAGGSAAARTLTRAGMQVLVLEEGQRLTEVDFRGKDMTWALRNLYRDRGFQVFQGDVIGPLQAGRAVGGGTVVNSAICFRGPPHRLEAWRTQSGIPWMTAERMSALYDDVEKTIGVSDTNPFIARKNNLVFLRGAEKLGLKCGFIRRNAPGCMGCGVCHMGCPSGGKWSVDKNYLRQAEDEGASVLPLARASELIMDGKRCTGVRVDMLDTAGNTVGSRVVNAGTTVLAAGAVGTPLVLLKNGVGPDNGHIGRHLCIHPGLFTLAMHDEEIKIWSGVPQGAWADIPDEPEAICETFNAPADIFYLLAAQPGAAGLEFMKTANHLGGAGVMVRDGDCGRVEAGDDWRARITYSLTPADVLKGVRGMRTLVKIHFAAGARAVHPGRTGTGFKTTEAEALAALTDDMKATDFVQMYGSHPMATCRMNANDREGVVAPDGSVHGTRNLYVVDASIFPDALGMNPQMTVMALATHLAEGIARSRG